MTDDTDPPPLEQFVQTLPRKVAELRGTLATLVADPRSQRVREELRRRLQALYTVARSFELPVLSEGLREGIAHLDTLRGAPELCARDLETLADLLATLPALAQRDAPESAGSSFASASRASIASSLPGLPPMPQPMPAIPPAPAPPSLAGGPSIARPAGRPAAHLNVLVVARESTARDVRAALPPEDRVASVRTIGEALEIARAIAPDVVLAEVVPPASGANLLAALRADPVTDVLPVLLLAWPGDTVDPDKIQVFGGADIVGMPLEPEQMRTFVARAAHGSLRHSLPPRNFGEGALDELTRSLQDEIRRGIRGTIGPGEDKQGAQPMAASWETVSKVRDVVRERTRGDTDFEIPSGGLGLAGAYVLPVGADEENDAGGEDATDDPITGSTFVVVDDDPGVVWFFSGLLQGAGARVVECTDGEHALREARLARPDAVISDIIMPGLDGFGLCRAMRRDVSLRHTPTILLSWKEDLLAKMQKLGVPAQGFLRKEARGDAILSRVRAVLRPRTRMLRRLEQLEDKGDVRGRVEVLGVYALLVHSARVLRNATLTVTDSFSETELELRNGQLVTVVRTLRDGSLVRGETGLAQVLGSTSGRFVVRRNGQSVRGTIQGELDTVLEHTASKITALENAVSGIGALDVASMDMDLESAHSYARLLPERLRPVAEKLLAAGAVRPLVANEGFARELVEEVLVDLVRRGLLRGVRDGEGEDLTLRRPRAEPEEAPVEARTQTPGEGALRSGRMPRLSDPPPDLVPSWRPPKSVDEAAAPGFGVEEESGGLADAVLREILEPQVAGKHMESPAASPTKTDARAVQAPVPSASPIPEVPPVTSPPASADDDTPDFEGSEAEADLSTAELDAAVKAAPGVPLEGPSLDARGLPRKRPVPSSVPATESALAPADPDAAPAAKIIVDSSVLASLPPAREPSAFDAMPSLPPPRMRTAVSSWLGLVAAMVLLALGSYAVVHVILSRRDGAVLAPDANVALASDTSVPSVVVASPPEEDATSVPAADAAVVTAVVDAAAPVLGGALESGPPGPAVGSMPVYEDPGPYLDGGTLTPGRGLLVIEAREGFAGEVTVNQRAVGSVPVSVALVPGVHTVRFRSESLVVFRFVPIEAGRAVRMTVPAEM